MTKIQIAILCCLLTLGFSFCAKGEEDPVPEVEGEQILIPQIVGEWWQVAGNPMDHKYATPRQEPIDFAVWQAADGTW